MSELEPLVIGDLVVEKPIIQGGMGVGISLHKLAGAVAKAGAFATARSIILTVHKVFGRSFGGIGVFLPEVLPGKEDGAHRSNMRS